MRKYELADQIKTIRNGHTLHQIRALIDIPRYGVKAGDLGGWIETENNLSHEGDCWVGGGARVGGGAQVNGNARVGGNAHVRNGVIKSTQDYLVVGPIGGRDDYTTFYRTKTGIWVCCGCFSGSIDEFLQAVKTKNKGTRYEQDYIAAAEFAKLKVWGTK